MTAFITLPRFLSAPKSIVLTGLLGLAFAAGAAEASNITRGNLVVVRVGDGSAALSNASTPVFLDEITTAGASVQTLALPIAAAGANQAFTNSGSATSEGSLNVSADGNYLVQAGYGTAPGLVSVASSTNPTVARVVARIDLTGAIDTSTAIGDAFSANNIRSATSDDGSRFWAVGANSGVRFATLGSTTSVQLNTALPTNCRIAGIFGGNLYISSSSGAFQGVAQVGSGLPTTAGQTPTLLNGFPTAAGPSAYDFFFADAQTLYVADDRASASGGIQKWTESGGLWTLQYTLNPAASIGCRSVSGVVNGSVVTLYATTAHTSANQVVSVVDTGALSTFTTLATAATNTIFRGVRLVPGASGGGPGTGYCFGDGTGTACPCGNVGSAGNGCPSSINAAGANLTGSGSASVGTDTLVLTGSGMPNSSALYFQGTLQVAAGAGAAFGDGKRCVGGSVIRLATQTNVAGTSQYPEVGEPLIHIKGLVAAGNVRDYQVWYRNAAAFCNPETFNLSNGYEVAWTP